MIFYLTPFLHYVNTPLGPHHIRTKLYSVPLKLLYDLHEKAKDASYLDSSTTEYRLVHMVVYVAHHRIFGPPRVIDECELKKPRRFLRLGFDNGEIEAVNVSNIISHVDVLSSTRPCFGIKFTSCVSYGYTSTVASSLFNCRQTLRCLGIGQLRRDPPKCSCSSSPFN
jgi:hypothetical protein